MAGALYFLGWMVLGGLAFGAWFPLGVAYLVATVALIVWVKLS
jgi:hypothetical protein